MEERKRGGDRKFSGKGEWGFDMLQGKKIIKPISLSGKKEDEERG